MTERDWQLQTPISAVVFDCDGTLTTIEGVNELAKHHHVYDAVEAMTTEAMGQTGINPALYEKRLQLIQPSQQQIQQLAEQYIKHRTPDSEIVIQILQRLNKKIFLLSAGMNPAVSLFGEMLRIPPSHIYAVNLFFDEQGRYLDFDHDSPLIHNNGKREIVYDLQHQYPHLLHIGDGLNDFSTHDIVTRFIGYGGVYFRENLKSQCQYYIETLSLSPILPLCLTADEHQQLTKEENQVYQKGMLAIEEQRVKVG